MDFEWDPSKRRENLDKHGVDFLVVAQTLMQDLRYTAEVHHTGPEQRHVAIGPLPSGAIPPKWSGPLCAVFYTMRDERQTCRIISARRARKNERERYRAYVREGS